MSRGLVLASRSPQRRAILEQLGVRFVVRPTEAEELTEGEPRALALENARRKAAACPAEPGETVLGVDTDVALDGRIFGKPVDEAQAREFLRALGGRTHEVVSGLAIALGVPERRALRNVPRRSGGPPRCVADTVAVTEVTFRALDDAWIDWYVATGEWRERAGGYAIQGRGAALVERIDGDYLNVVGLPVAALVDLLPELLH